MRDVHPWLREWRGLVVEPGDIGLVTDQEGGQMLIMWMTHADGQPFLPHEVCWCDREIVEVLGRTPGGEL
jgi:hypothetical protein